MEKSGKSVQPGDRPSFSQLLILTMSLTHVSDSKKLHTAMQGLLSLRFFCVHPVQ